MVKGDEIPLDERDAWEWLRNPLPPGDEEPLVANLRLQLGIPDNAFFTDKGFGSLEFFAQQSVLQTLAPGFYQQHNPIVRHTVLRRRQTLEEAGLLERVAVESASRSRCPLDRLSRRAFRRSRLAHEPPVRPRLSSRRRFHYRLADSAPKPPGS